MILFALPWLFFWRIVTPVVADQMRFPAGDLTSQYFALRFFAAGELQQGGLPLWDPYINLGQPALADTQSATFYLPAFIFAQIARPFSFPLFQNYIITLFSIAAVNTYLFARVFWRSRFAGVIAALAFTFGGYLTYYPVQQVTILETIIWLPLLLLCLEFAATRRSLVWSVFAGIVLATVVLAGHPQTALYVVYTAIAFYLWRSLLGVPVSKLWQRVSRRGPVCKRKIVRDLAGVALRGLVWGGIGLGLAAVQILPTAEFTHLSTRAQLNYHFNANGFSPSEFLGLLISGPFGGIPLYTGVVSVLLVVVGLALAILPVRRGRDMRWSFWSFTGVTALLLSMGGNSFLYSVFYLLVPGFNAVRQQERAAAIVSFSLAMLAGYGALLLSRPMSQKVRRQFDRITAGLGWASGIAVLIALLLYIAWAAIPGADGKGSPVDPFVTRYVFVLVIFLIAAGLIAARRGLRLPLVAIQVLLCIVLVVDLFSANWKLNLEEGLAINQFPDERVAQFTINENPPGSQPYRVSSEANMHGEGNGGIVYRVEDIIGNTPFKLSRFETLDRALGNDDWRRWQLFNVKYLFVKREINDPRLEFIGKDDPTGINLYRLKPEATMPRAWLVGQVDQVTSDDIAIKNVVSPTYDIRNRAVVVVNPDEPLPASVRLPAAPATGTAQVVERTGGAKSVYETDASAPSMLVISEAYYPGWHARVDGRDVPLLRVDYMMRGVPLDSGKHRVEVYFESAPVIQGATLSLLTLAVALILLLAGAVMHLWSGRRLLSLQSLKRRVL